MASASVCSSCRPVLPGPSSTPPQRLVKMIPVSCATAELPHPLYRQRDAQYPLQRRIRGVMELPRSMGVPKASCRQRHSQHPRHRYRLCSQASLACHSWDMQYSPAASHPATLLKRFNGLRVSRASRVARSKPGGSFRGTFPLVRAAANSSEASRVSLVEVS